MKQNLVEIKESPEKKQKQSSFQKKQSRHQTSINSYDIRSQSNISSGYVPLADRKMTDLGFLIVFYIFVVAMIGVSIYGWTKGNVNKLIAPMPDGGKVFCGFENAADYGFLFISQFEDKNSHRSYCVKNCPTENGDISAYPGNITVPGYKTKTLGSYCIPDDKTVNEDLMNQIYASNFQFFGQLQNLWQPMVIAKAISLLYAIFYLYLMAHCVNLLAYMAIILMHVIFIGGAGGMVYGAIKSPRDSLGLYIGAGCLVFCVLLFDLMICCYKKQLKIALVIIAAAADFATETKRLIFVQMLFFFIYVTTLLAWFTAAIGVYSSGGVIITESGSRQVQITGKEQGLLAFMIVGLWWIGFNIHYMTQFIICNSAATYYFNSTKEKEGSASVTKALYLGAVTHAGSIALCGLLMTLIQILKAISEIISGAARDSKDGAAQVIACLIACCVKQLEQMVEYITEMGLAFQAVSGDPFCKSAWSGFLLNLKHLAKFYFARTLTGLFVLMGVLLNLGVSVGLFYALVYLMRGGEVIKDAGYLAIPVAVFGFVISIVFLSIFGDAVTAILMCFGIDLELHGYPAKYGPPNFHEAISGLYEYEGEDAIYHGKAISNKSNINQKEVGSAQVNFSHDVEHPFYQNTQQNQNQQPNYGQPAQNYGNQYQQPNYGQPAQNYGTHQNNMY